MEKHLLKVARKRKEFLSPSISPLFIKGNALGLMTQLIRIAITNYGHRTGGYHQIVFLEDRLPIRGENVRQNALIQSNGNVLNTLRTVNAQKRIGSVMKNS